MIPEYCLTEWRQQVSWVEDYQVEQDLIISRALVSLYDNPKIKDHLVFRGGTALHKLYIKPAAREINTTEHFHVFDFVDYELSVENSWFTGKSALCTYQLNELMGTKIRALYQRRKDRDLFDLWIVLKDNLIDPEIVLKVFLAHCDKNNQNATRALFERNLHEKLRFDDFRHDASGLLAESHEWSFKHAYEMVRNSLLSLLPEEPWKID